MSTINIQISKMKNNYKFNKWFSENWNKTGGLITYSAAAEIIGCSRSYISKLINEEKLKKYQYLSTKNKFISRHEILDFKSKINYEKENLYNNSNKIIEIARENGVTKTSILKCIITNSFNEIIKFKERNAISKKAVIEILSQRREETGNIKAIDIAEAIKHAWNKGTEDIEKTMDDNIINDIIELRNEQVKNNDSIQNDDNLQSIKS